MALLSFGAMFVLMYAMVDRFDDATPNLNQAYMAGLMTAPMLVIELLLMRMMYPNPKLNVVVLAASVVLGVLCFAGIRQQTLISDRQFLLSMIPHHSGALLMCREAQLNDPEIQELCRQIEASQTKEIAQMNAILQRLEK